MNNPKFPDDTTISESNSSWQSSSALVTRNTQGHQIISMNNPLCTPRRQNRPVGFTTPAVVIFGNPQGWTRSDHDDSQIAPFVPNPSTQLDASVFSISVSPHPSRQFCIQQSNFNSWAPCPSEFADPRSGSGLDLPEERFNTINSDQDVFQSQPQAPVAAMQPLRAPAPVTDFNALFTTIMSTIPPVFPAAPPALASTQSLAPGLSYFPQNQPVNATSRKTSILRDELVPVEGALVLHAGSAVPEARHGHAGSWRSSVAPSGSQLPRSLLPPQARRPNVLRQGNFVYEQVDFIKCMKHRWNFYLCVEDPFPVNVRPAQELCLRYAEKTLGAPREAYEISQKAFDYVRKKDSGIRNGFLNGLLKVVEEGYDVTVNSKLKIAELISNLNFAHGSYDVVTKKITGRYRHPCLTKVMQIILFTRRSRGRPVGVRFIRELLGDATGESDENLPNLAANTGAPVATIALACTVILHALHSIKAGDSSNRKSKTPKPVKFREGKYGGHYRLILAKIKQYPRLMELQKAYMEEIMREYLIAHASTSDDSEDELDFDDEMLSDGE